MKLSHCWPLASDVLNYQSCRKIAAIHSQHFNAIMCAISNNVQRGDPYSRQIWQLQPPLSDPLPHPLGAERNPHTEQRQHSMTINGEPGTHTRIHTYTHTNSHSVRRAGRLRGNMRVVHWKHWRALRVN